VGVHPVVVHIRMFISSVKQVEGLVFKTINLSHMYHPALR
jgi:hypothetical protein